MHDDREPPLDRAALDGLEAVLGRDRMRGFIGEYVVQAERLRGELHQAWGRRDWEATYRPAHNLVSNAGNFGAQKVAALADTIQRAARDHDEATAQAALARLDQALEEARAELIALFPQT